MTIRNNNGKNISLENSNKIKAEVSFSDCIVIELTEPSGEKVLIDRPGEYEYKGIDIMSREVKLEEYKSCANVSKVTVDGVRTLFIKEGIEPKQDDLNQISDIDIILITEEMLEKLDKHVLNFDPKKVVIMQSKMSSAEITESVKKVLSGANISEAKQFKFKAEDMTPMALIEVYLLTK